MEGKEWTVARRQQVLGEAAHRDGSSEIGKFVATFLLLYITVLTVMGDSNSKSKCTTIDIQGIVWAFDGMIFALVYCTVGILVGHINLAVTFRLFLAWKLSLMRAVLYMVMQCLGAICGAGEVKGFEGNARYIVNGKKPML
ncbi:hypothetical protein K1719_005061 [Acacia pycnantha]|nr:hypothetical protein K1719_005061 [Acacia pycnantha]